LAKRPKALLADEPTGSLGEHLRDEVRDVLERVGKKPRLTFVMVTRDSALARTVPRLAPLCEGRITVRENAPA
jgi:putative ABC transport system ATP-binding protein